MHTPEDLRYTTEHEWVAPRGEHVRVGITDYAQDALGSVVYVQPPDVGSRVEAGTACGEVESTKSVSDLYAPLTGRVVAVNEALNATPELLNTDPYGDGWVCEIEPDDPSAVGELLTAAQYQALIEG